jgi:hypothetical protein
MVKGKSGIFGDFWGDVKVLGSLGELSKIL